MHVPEVAAVEHDSWSAGMLDFGVEWLTASWCWHRRCGDAERTARYVAHQRWELAS